MDPIQQRAAAHHRRSHSFSILIVSLLFATQASMVLPSPPPPTFNGSFSILHQVPEGHVGVYWRGGALLHTINEPGFHLKIPFITRYETVQVHNILCGTKGGIMISFEKIEVVNQLHKEYVYETLLNYGVHYNKIWINDKIHHHINQFCTSHSLQQVYIDDFDKIGEKIKEALQIDCARYAPGIEIFFVYVTKPTIPDSISRIFEQIEEERIKKVAEKEADTSKKTAISEIAKFIKAIGEIAERQLVKYAEAIGEIDKRHLVKYLRGHW